MGTDDVFRRLQAQRAADKAHIRSVQEKHEPAEFGNPTNADRAAWAHKALEAFAIQTGELSEVAEFASNWDEDCLGEVAGGLIGDLLHLARVNGFNPNVLLERGVGHFETEVEDEESE